MVELFQFHKVRLKEPTAVIPYRRIRFQFHKVRLKECDGMDLLNMSTFQFHKVRLKVNERQGELCWQIVVSIP